jgi:hypothetical protein
MQELPDLDLTDARPVNQQIAAHLREAIESGALAAGRGCQGRTPLRPGARHGVPAAQVAEWAGHAVEVLPLRHTV